MIFSSEFYIPIIKKWGRQFFLLLVLVGFVSTAGLSQSVPESFANNATSVEWKQIESAHFKIVFPVREASIDSLLASRAERIYDEFSARLGVSPSKIQIYYNNQDELVCGIHARDIDDEFSIWRGNPLTGEEIVGHKDIEEHLRFEIAYAFQEYVRRFPNDYWFYLFSRPSKSPWSDGFISYMASPQKKADDLSFQRNYRSDTECNQTTRPITYKWHELMSGRSQIHYFNNIYHPDSLRAIYSERQALLGRSSYFDFNPAFKNATGINYDEFKERWQENMEAKYGDPLNIESDEEERSSSSVFLQDSSHRFQGISVSDKGRRIASIGIPTSGSEIQQLRLSSTDGSIDEFSIISEGFFHPQMDWNMEGDKLAYARRTFDPKAGGYSFQIYIWSELDKKTTKLKTDQNSKTPVFSGTGKQLAYTVSEGPQTTLHVQNLGTGSIESKHDFTELISVTHLDYHPTDQKLLISYKEGQTYTVGLFNIKTEDFSSFSIQADIPLMARWSPKGDAIFFNKEKNGVANIYSADVASSTLTNKELVTNDYVGLELWGLTADLNGATKLLATTKATSAPNKILAYQPKSLEAKNSRTTATDSLSSAISDDNNSVKSGKVLSRSGVDAKPYNAFLNTQWERPFFIPYFLSSSDFGLAGYLSLKEPMRIHEFDYYGSISLADPIGKSFFYSEYVNNSFRPKIEVSFNHFPSAAEWFGKSREVKTTNVLALSALWKLDKSSQDYSNWYGGFTIRHLAFDYFPTASLRLHHPNVFFKNRATQQTDLRLSLSWHSLKPNRHNLIHPPDGTGMRFSATASDKFFASNVRYARFNLDSYTILPGIQDHRIFLYANGVMDVGEPAGNDYLSFADNGDYQLPGEDFVGSINPGVDRFVRGYTKPLLGDQFLFAKFEYRIPFQFNTKKKILGLIPPARTSLTFFTDGGVMGNARITENKFSTEYRYSAGAEIKRIFSFGGSFKLTYELGLAQPLNQSLSPQPYFNVKSALPF